MPKTSLLLVVEDDPHIRQLVHAILEDEGYEVSEASNGEEALVMISAKMPALILLDLQMPKMTGWALMELLEKSHISVPIIIMSAQRITLEQASKLGEVGCLDKPFELIDLLAEVAKYAKPATP